MRRSPDGRHVAKTSARRADLAGERDRLAWLAGTAVGAPRVVDWIEPPGVDPDDDDVGRSGGATLVMTTLSGIPASAVAAVDAERAAHAVGRLLRTLHGLDVAGCPFDRRLAVTLPRARAATEAGTVDVEDLDAERRGRSPGSLLLELEATATPEPAHDLVVCHGDASLPNLFVDPTTHEPTGVLDVGRLGVADRHLDLALVLRSVRDERNAAYGRPREPALWQGYGLGDGVLDERRLELYRLLDEFF